MRPQGVRRQPPSPSPAAKLLEKARAMSEDMQRKWDAAFANPGEAIPVGETVVCDDCNGDYTNRADSGGFIFESKAICPTCAPGWRQADRPLRRAFDDPRGLPRRCDLRRLRSRLARPGRRNPGHAGAAMTGESRLPVSRAPTCAASGLRKRSRRDRHAQRRRKLGWSSAYHHDGAHCSRKCRVPPPRRMRS